MSLDLFAYAETQKQAAKLGMERAVDRAERVTEGWKQEAFTYLLRFASANHNRDFLAEEIAPWAYERGCTRPPDDRAWGAIIQRAGRENVIRKTGLAAKNKLSGNASTWRPLWEVV